MWYEPKSGSQGAAVCVTDVHITHHTLLHVTSELKLFTVIWAQIKAHDCLQRLQ